MENTALQSLVAELDAQDVQAQASALAAAKRRAEYEAKELEEYLHEPMRKYLKGALGGALELIEFVEGSEDDRRIYTGKVAIRGLGVVKDGRHELQVQVSWTWGDEGHKYSEQKVFSNKKVYSPDEVRALVRASAVRALEGEKSFFSRRSVSAPVVTLELPRAAEAVRVDIVSKLKWLKESGVEFSARDLHTIGAMEEKFLPEVVGVYSQAASVPVASAREGAESLLMAQLGELLAEVERLMQVAAEAASLKQRITGAFLEDRFKS